MEDMQCVYRLLAPKLDALGSPLETATRWEEFMKSWPGQWQSMVTALCRETDGAA